MTTDPALQQLRKRKIEQLAELTMTGLMISGKHSTAKYTAENAYELAEEMLKQREKRFGPLCHADM